MKTNICLSVLLAIGCLSAANAAWQFEARDIPAPSLAHNLVGESCVQSIGVYLPPSYTTAVDRHYPVIYSLHGWGDGIGRDWYLDMLADEWEGAPQQEFIWVHLSGVNQFRGSFYTNSAVTGDWGDFISQDVVSYMDAHYRTLKNAANRAITGHSMGGTGCIELGMQHPEVFSIVYALSPGLMLPEDVNAWHVTESEVIDKIENHFSALRESGQECNVGALLERMAKEDDWRVFFSLGYGMAYAGDPSLPLPFFDYTSAEVGGKKVLSENTLEVYRKGFGQLSEKVQRYEEALKKLDLLVIDCGYHDDFPWIYRGSKYFSDVLDQHQISHSLILHQGDHGSLLQQQLMHSMIPLVVEHFRP